MKRYIYITTQFEGIHRYKYAPEEVAYLREYHRHLFKIKLQVKVLHNERDIEFIAFKKRIDEYIAQQFANRQLDFSCETIAEKLINFVRENYLILEVKCEVSEDGENGAILESE